MLRCWTIHAVCETLLFGHTERNGSRVAPIAEFENFTDIHLIIASIAAMRVLGSTFTDIQGFGDQLFTVIILVVCAGITSHMCFGFGTKKAKETFIALILVLIVGTQFFHLITAVTYIPISKNYAFDVSHTHHHLRFLSHKFFN